jgi:hypothetical protein
VEGNVLESLIDLWAIGALITGIGYMGWIFSKQRLVARSQTWPSTPGTIMLSKIDVNSRLTGPSHTANRTYGARIKYHFKIGPRVYTGKTICLGGVLNTSFKSRAENRVEKYSKGATATVYYNPENPKINCLERDGEIAMFGYLIGGGFALFALVVLMQ